MKIVITDLSVAFSQDRVAFCDLGYLAPYATNEVLLGHGSPSTITSRDIAWRGIAGGVVEGLGRFGDPAVLILSSLAEGPKHGYALIKDIEQFAGTLLGPGTVYAAIGRLEQRGLVAPLPEQERRRPYQITASGAEALRSYLQHARAVTTAGLRRLEAFG